MSSHPWLHNVLPTERPFLSSRSVYQTKCAICRRSWRMLVVLLCLFYLIPLGWPGCCNNGVYWYIIYSETMPTAVASIVFSFNVDKKKLFLIENCWCLVCRRDRFRWLSIYWEIFFRWESLLLLVFLDCWVYEFFAADRDGFSGLFYD